MKGQAAIAPVRKTVHVKVPIEHAFEVFTSGLTRWWPHNHGIGKKPIQNVLMEPRLGGPWLEIAEELQPLWQEHEHCWRPEEGRPDAGAAP